MQRDKETAMLGIHVKTGFSTQGIGFRHDLVIPSDPELRPHMWLFDFASPLSWAKQDQPADEDPVHYPGGVNPGRINIAAGESLTWSGGGIDFSSIDQDDCAVYSPAGLLTDVWGGGAGAQEFSVTGWCTLPSEEDWNSSSTVSPMFTTSSSVSGWATAADLGTVYQHSDGTLKWRRQLLAGTAGGAGALISLNPAGMHEQIVQWNVFKTATKEGFRIRRWDDEVGDEIIVNVGANNSQDFGANLLQWGGPYSFFEPETITEHRDASNWKLFRGWFENNAGSGRDPIQVRDLDFELTAERIRAEIFS
jgi:hypothetical protein